MPNIVCGKAAIVTGAGRGIGPSLTPLERSNDVFSWDPV
jgi:hypothetical protein